MWPYGYHPNAVAENSHELEGLAIDAVSALDVINSLSTRAPIGGKNNQCHFEARLQNNQCHFEARLQNEACRQEVSWQIFKARQKINQCHGTVALVEMEWRPC